MLAELVPPPPRADQVGHDVAAPRAGKEGHEDEVPRGEAPQQHDAGPGHDDVIDILAMMGDAVDNIPGLQGVGEKTALKFVQQFGSIESLIANTSKIQGKLRQKIEASAEQGLLSKKLATIICDVPIDFEQDYEIGRASCRERV